MEYKVPWEIENVLEEHCGWDFMSDALRFGGERAWMFLAAMRPRSVVVFSLSEDRGRGR